MPPAPRGTVVLAVVALLVLGPVGTVAGPAIGIAGGADGAPVPSAAAAAPAATAAPAPDGTADPAEPVASARTPVAAGTGGEAGTDDLDTAAAGTARTDELRYIDADTTLSLTPDEPGYVAAELAVEFPDGVSEFAVTLGGDGEVVGTTGFVADGEEYVWDGETDAPRLQLRIRANRTTTRAPEVVEDGYTAVDTGNWAIVPVPRFGARWSWTGGTVRLSRSVDVAGAGATGGSLAYLGEHETVTRSTAGQTIRLVVPRSASLAEPRAAILDELARASERLAVGERDPRVTVIAAPRRIDWGVAGLQLGESDAWVVADSALDTPNNVWLHEYVHTRQNLSTTPATRWLVEATANYYAGLLTYERGLITYEELREYLARGTARPVRSAVLDDPTTWPSLYVPYEKGSLVAGAIDRQLRLASDGAVSLESVLARLNGDDSIEGGEFVAAVADTGGSEVGGYAERHVTTSNVPETWSRAEHATAFDTAVAFTYELPATDAFALRGPYRNATASAPLELVTDESLVATVAVSNTGTAGGPFNATMAVNGTLVAGTAGTLEAGGSTTVQVEHTFTRVGHYGVRVGDRTVHVVVLPPATATVVERAVAPAEPSVGATVTLSATIENRADRPGDREVSIVVDGEPLVTRRVHLRPGESRTITATTTFDAAGEYGVSIAGEERTVTVHEGSTAPSDTARSGSGETSPSGDAGTGSGPGGAIPAPGPIGVLAALAIAAVLVARRSPGG